MPLEIEVVEGKGMWRGGGRERLGEVVEGKGMWKERLVECRRWVRLHVALVMVVVEAGLHMLVKPHEAALMGALISAT